jgi:hypothetical protein
MNASRIFPCGPRALVGFRGAKQFTLPMVIHRKAASPAFSAAIETTCRRAGLTRLLGATAVLLAERLPGPRSARG